MSSPNNNNNLSSPPAWIVSLISSIGAAAFTSLLFLYFNNNRPSLPPPSHSPPPSVSTSASSSSLSSPRLESTLEEILSLLQQQQRSSAAASLLSHAQLVSNSTVSNLSNQNQNNTSSTPTPTNIRTSAIYSNPNNNNPNNNLSASSFSLSSPAHNNISTPPPPPLLFTTLSSFPSSALPPSSSSPRLTPKKSPAVIVVDPFSTGANLAAQLTARGMPVIRVLSGFMSSAVLALVDDTITMDFVASISHDAADPYKTISSILALPFHVLSVLSGSELGVEVTDYISEGLGLPSNGTELTQARRDKYQMGEMVRRSGVRAVKQSRVTNWQEVENFIHNDLKLSLSTFKLILKPIKSAGSDNVYLTTSIEECKEKFHIIMGAQNQLGAVNDAVVIQEYLEGSEYVVDTVSKDGKHKVIALWKYDKEKVNGRNFVYLGMSSLSGNSPIGQSISQYIFKVLDALHIHHGAGHAEVIMTRTGPCLVEVGARAHGAEFTFGPVADACWGYNQISALVDSVIDEEKFYSLPDVCGDEKVAGYKVDFVSYVEGKLVQFKHIDDMQKLSSFLKFDLLPKIGDNIPITIDCFTAVGSVSLVNRDKKQLDDDVLLVRKWERDMFVVEKGKGEKDKEEKKVPRAGP